MPSTCDATEVAYVTASRSKYESWNHTDSRPAPRARRAHSTVSVTSPREARPSATRGGRAGRCHCRGEGGARASGRWAGREGRGRRGPGGELGPPPAGGEAPAEPAGGPTEPVRTARGA